MTIEAKLSDKWRSAPDRKGRIVFLQLVSCGVQRSYYLSRKMLLGNPLNAERVGMLDSILLYNVHEKKEELSVRILDKQMGFMGAARKL